MEKLLRSSTPQTRHFHTLCIQSWSFLVALPSMHGAGAVGSSSSIDTTLQRRAPV
jgi:hypothetical protein